MNERFQELHNQARDFYLQDEYMDLSMKDLHRLVESKFAELIIKECEVALSPMLRDMVSRGQAYDLIKKHFGIEERKGWVCPKCGIDRTKDVCPKGHTAAITGDCPMTATAQSGVEE